MTYLLKNQALKEKCKYNLLRLACLILAFKASSIFSLHETLWGLKKRLLTKIKLLSAFDPGLSGSHAGKILRQIILSRSLDPYG